MRYLIVLLFCLLPVFSYAAEATDIAKDPVLEKRMIGLAEKLRCLVCQNESLASSRADLAEDLRREVREQMQKGKNDQEIIDYLVSRYGDFVLYDPPMKKSTLILWLGPFALLLVGIGLLGYQVRKRKTLISDSELSAEDARRASELLGESQEISPTVSPLPNPLPPTSEGASESLSDAPGNAHSKETQA
jgi:cytochrome c-type biogenesis protein CcmH